MKKSFIIHCDSLSVIDKMKDEQVGKLLRKMKSYHNGNDYVCDDFSVELVFEQFKNQFDRDLEKYNRICERNANNGAKGGRPSEPKEPNGLSGNPKKPKKADSDNDSNSDNDSDKEKQASAGYKEASAGKIKQLQAVNVNVLCINNIYKDIEGVKKRIYGLYDEKLVSDNISKFRLLVLFIAKGYNKVIDSKEGCDDFFSMMIDKSNRYGHSGPGFADWDKLLLKAKEMYDWAEGGREIKNHMSTFNKFLAPTTQK